MKKQNTNQSPRVERLEKIIPEEKDERAITIASQSKSNKRDMGNSSPEDNLYSKRKDLRHNGYKNTFDLDDVREAVKRLIKEYRSIWNPESLVIAEYKIKEVFGEELIRSLK